MPCYFAACQSGHSRRNGCTPKDAARIAGGLLLQEYSEVLPRFNCCGTTCLGHSHAIILAAMASLPLETVLHILSLLKPRMPTDDKRQREPWSQWFTLRGSCSTDGLSCSDEGPASSCIGLQGTSTFVQRCQNYLPGVYQCYS